MFFARNKIEAFFKNVDKILGIFERLIEEGRELIQQIETEINHYEATIRRLHETKQEIEESIRRLKKVIGDE